ncbi:MAG: DUF6951 family protein [Desulfopila sp.]
MTKVSVYAGICGFNTHITSVDQGSFTAKISLDSDCPNWVKVNEIFASKEFNAMTELFKNKETGKLDSEIFDISLSTIPHVSCPVISGILKALEVSVGLALPKDATITFDK